METETSDHLMHTPDVDFFQTERKTPFQRAVDTGNVAAAKALLKHGANVNYRGSVTILSSFCV